MKPKMNSALPAVVACALVAGCASMEQVREDTRAVGLLVKSVGTSAETYQIQRDLLAKASMRNRQALEQLALRQEGDVASSLAAWDVAGDVERKRIFEAVRTQSDRLALAREQAKARQHQQKADLAAARSAVNFELSKIAASSSSLLKLGEGRSKQEEAMFLIKFAKEIRADIQKDGEAAASSAANEAAAALAAKGGQ